MKQKRQAEVCCSSACEKWCKPGSIVKVELPGFGDDGRAIMREREARLLGKPGKRQACEGRPTFQSCSLEGGRVD